MWYVAARLSTRRIAHTDDTLVEWIHIALGANQSTLPAESLNSNTYCGTGDQAGYIKIVRQIVKDCCNL